MCKCFVIIPCYNENKVVQKVIEKVMKYNVNVVVVDDGSSVSVRPLLEQMNIHLIQHCINLGQGAALQTGNHYALSQGADYIIHFDADGQHDAKYIPLFINYIKNNEVDIVLGSRFLEEISIKEIPFARKILLKTARWFNWIFTGLLLTDAHNGFRILSKKAAEKIVFTQNRMSYATELLTLCKKHNLKVEELPIVIKYTDYSIKKGQKNSDALNIIFDLITNSLFR